jgi:hypothetical protein
VPLKIPAEHPRLARVLFPVMTSSTVVRPYDLERSAALRLAAAFAFANLLLTFALTLWTTHIGYSYFRDEFYYLACGRHLAWGYVDHGPIVALQARLAETIFGESVFGIRALSACAGAAMVFLGGMICWALGGHRPAQALTMLGLIVTPQYIGVDGFLSMNSFEAAFWSACVLAIIMILRGSSPARWWTFFGIVAGIGLLNKPSMTFFLVALLLALLLTPQRRLLWSRWAAAGVALLLLITLPNLLWQVHNHWPTLEFLRNDAAGNKSIKLAPVDFVVKQIINLGPQGLLIWGAGLVHLLRRKDARWLGLTYLIFLAIMMALHAKDYYVSPIYPVLYAAGGIAWERRFAQRRSVINDRAFAFPIYAIVLIAIAIYALPLSLPLMPPAQWVRYTKATGLSHFNGNSEAFSSGPLPQFYADRFGWQEEVDQVARVYNALPPEQRKVTGILCSNYGQASAINFLGHGLPFAISRHNNYYLWGPHGYSFDSMILIERTTPEHLHTFYNSVTVVGRMDNPWAMPFERRNTIFLLQGLKVPASAIWNPQEKNYF